MLFSAFLYVSNLIVKKKVLNWPNNLFIHITNIYKAMIKKFEPFHKRGLHFLYINLNSLPLKINELRDIVGRS